MKHINPYTYLTMCIFILLVIVTSCETEKMQQNSNYVRLNVDMVGSDSGSESIADTLKYSIYLFEADKALSGSVPDNNAYFLKKIHCSISKHELSQLSYSFDNYKLEEKLFRLLVFSTPKIAECKIIDISENREPDTTKTKFSDIRLSMIMKGNEYVPLSRNNFYGIENFSGQDVKDGKTISITTSLTRAVGQLVFDIFKIDGSLDKPIGIENTTIYSSVIDRIKEIKMEVLNPTLHFNPGDGTVVVDEEKLVQYNIIPVLKDDSYLVTIADQKDTELIEIPNKNLKGSVRIFGPYLLTSDTITNLPGKIKVDLTFSYYDTTPIYSVGNNEGLDPTYNEKELVLHLPTGKSDQLKIAPNHYTVTHIGIQYNRIIDIKTSGDLSFETKWDN